MMPENLQNEHLKNVARGLTFEASDQGKENGKPIEQETEKLKRNMVRKRALRSVRPERSRKRAQ